LSEEPIREEAHAGLMRVHALSGRRRQALEQYELLSEILRRELGMEPAAEIRRLYEEILSDKFPPAQDLSPAEL
jgi:DNA-binding SARP family transcriptional activator